MTTHGPHTPGTTTSAPAPRATWARGRRLSFGIGLALVAVIAVLLINGATSPTSAADAASSGRPNNVAGTWSLVSVVVDPDGEAIEPYGPDPRGQLIFTQGGRWSGFVQDPDVPEFAAGAVSGGTAEENAAAVVGSSANMGSYTVDRDGNWASEVLEGSTFPNWNGIERATTQDEPTDRVLTITVEGDRMTEVISDPGSPAILVEWERVR